MLSTTAQMLKFNREMGCYNNERVIMSPTIALLTDFGITDVYVGVMKAVMRAICPSATFIDLTHAVQPQNVREGAYHLFNSYRYFPKGTVFLVVVDPGVGSARRPIIVQSNGYIFIAPDNGILSYTLRDLGLAYEAYELANPEYHLPDMSVTFHGRDIFAPAAAHAAAGVPLTQFGARLEQIKSLPAPQMVVQEHKISGEVMHIDHFGNVATSIGKLRWLSSERLRLEPCFGDRQTPVPIAAPTAVLRIHDVDILGISRAYHEGVRGDFMMLINSNGFLEVALNQDNAATRLDVRVGDHVNLTLRGDEPGRS